MVSFLWQMTISGYSKLSIQPCPGKSRSVLTSFIPHLFNFFTLIPRHAATATSTATMKMSSEMVAISPMKVY